MGTFPGFETTLSEGSRRSPLPSPTHCVPSPGRSGSDAIVAGLQSYFMSCLGALARKVTQLLQKLLGFLCCRRGRRPGETTPCSVHAAVETCGARGSASPVCLHVFEPLRLAENAPVTAEKVQMGLHYPLGTKPML